MTLVDTRLERAFNSTIEEELRVFGKFRSSSEETSSMEKVFSPLRTSVVVSSTDEVHQISIENCFRDQFNYIGIPQRSTLVWREISEINSSIEDNFIDRI